MSIARTITRRVATVNYSANSTVQTQLTGVTGRLRRIFLEMQGSLLVTTAGTNYAESRNPGSLVPSLMLRLNHQVVLKQGAWKDWLDRSYVFNGQLPAQVACDATADTDAFRSRIELPFITPRGARPIDTVLNLGPDDRLDLDITFADDNALVNSSTLQSLSVAPTINVVAEMEAHIEGITPDPVGLYRETAFETNPGAGANTDYQSLQMTTAPGLEYHHLVIVQEDAVVNTGRTLEGTITDLTLQQQGGGQLSQPFGIISGEQLQHDFNVRHRCIDAVRTGVYPVVFQAAYEGRWNYNLDSTNLDDLRFIVNYSAPTTNAFFRVLQGTIERF
jgi:hypothetical protein